MSSLSNVQLMLILALYYFDKGKNIEAFTKKYNAYFNKDISAQTVLFHVSKFRNADPANNIGIEENDEYKLVWNEYIAKDRIKELKELYVSFKKGEFIQKTILVEDDIAMELKGTYAVDIVDLPQEKPEQYRELGRKAYPRSKEVVSNAILFAKAKCEAECSNELFYRKDGITTYTEAHHLIPLSYQDYFEFSLDVEANVISLCPMCHRLLHYGMKTDELLRKLHEERKTRLKNCSIDISYEELLLMYR